MIYFFTKAQFEARLSAKKVKRIYDDNSDGVADVDPVNQLRADATSKVRSYIEPMGIMTTLLPLFNQTTGEVLTNSVLPDEIIRLSLDVGVALAAQRHPEVMRQDWRLLMEQCDKDLARLRDGKTSLGGGTQGGVATPPTEIQGATATFPADTAGTAEADRTSVFGKMGDFS